MCKCGWRQNSASSIFLTLFHPFSPPSLPPSCHLFLPFTPPPSFSLHPSLPSPLSTSLPRCRPPTLPNLESYRIAVRRGSWTAVIVSAHSFHSLLLHFFQPLFIYSLFSPHACSALSSYAGLRACVAQMGGATAVCYMNVRGCARRWIVPSKGCWTEAVKACSSRAGASSRRVTPERLCSVSSAVCWAWPTCRAFTRCQTACIRWALACRTELYSRMHQDAQTAFITQSTLGGKRVVRNYHLALALPEWIGTPKMLQLCKCYAHPIDVIFDLDSSLHVWRNGSVCMHRKRHENVYSI